jgi:hypothetical protein
MTECISTSLSLPFDSRSNTRMYGFEPSRFTCSGSTGLSFLERQSQMQLRYARAYEQSLRRRRQRCSHTRRRVCLLGVISCAAAGRLSCLVQVFNAPPQLVAREYAKECTAGNAGVANKLNPLPLHDCSPSVKVPCCIARQQHNSKIVMAGRERVSNST